MPRPVHVVLALLLLPLSLTGCFVSDPGAHEPLVDNEGRLVGKQVRLLQVASGLDAPVWLTHAGDGSGRLFVAQQGGVVRVVVEDVLTATPYVDLSDRVGSEGSEQGLLGLAFHPDYPEDDRVFVSYTDKGGDSVLAVFASMSDDLGRLDPGSELVLLQVDQPYANHNGGMIAFGPDGYLYYGLGDGGSGGDPRGNGQDTSTLLGSILRLDVDAATGSTDAPPYGVPDDNPFVGREGADEIWAYGLRNPWRFSFDRETGDLWIGDVGQHTREEVSVLAPDQAGANLGWNGLEGTHVYDEAVHDRLPEDTVLPVAEYARGAPHCSVTGGYVFRGAGIPALEGTFVFGDYCSGWVWGLVPDGEGGYAMGRLFESNRQISSFGEDEDGGLYLADHGGGSVLRFSANGP